MTTISIPIQPILFSMAVTDPFEALRALRDTLPGASEPAGPAAGEDREAETKLTLTLFYERKGRGGKDATIIAAPEDCPAQRLASLASDLKKALATGGSVRGSEILLQGDRREALRRLLRNRGYTVKG